MGPVNPESIVALLADARLVEEETPPSELRNRVLERAMAARAGGRPEPRVDVADPVAAFARTVDELAAALEAVPDDAWSRAVAAYPGWTLADLTAHVLGVERYLGAKLGLWEWSFDPALEDDHLAVTAELMEGCRGRPGPEVRAEWKEAAGAIVQHLRGLGGDGLAKTVRFHNLRPDLARLLVVRVFELWTHTDDVRSALGVEVQAPDPGRLALMTEVVIRALPIGLALQGRPREGRTARVVLTGAGGGAWLQPLGIHEPGPPDTTVVADVVAFCRVAARRLRPAELGAAVEGDEDLANDVLVGIAAFAA